MFFTNECHTVLGKQHRVVIPKYVLKRARLDFFSVMQGCNLWVLTNIRTLFEPYSRCE